MPRKPIKPATSDKPIRGISRKEFAERLNVHPVTTYDYESTIPGFPKARRVTAGKVIFRDDEVDAYMESLEIAVDSPIETNVEKSKRRTA